MNERRSLLVNHWYAPPVGHAIEALRYCLGYHKADPSLEIGVLLNASTPWELANLCPFVERVLAPDFTDLFAGERDPTPALSDVPRDWDWVVEEHRSREDFQLEAFPGLRAFYEAARRHLRPRLGLGVVGASPPPYEPHHRLRLELPREARESVARELGDASVRIALMPAGSSVERGIYPSLASWRLIVGALAGAYPGALFCLVGKLRRDGRTWTAMTRDDVDRLAAACPRAVECFDRPLVEQLALVEACDLFLSPHTGFGAAAVSVGTPWLTISGGRWFEGFFNGVPFYSVVPDTKRYPAYPGWGDPLPLVDADVDGEGPRTPSMSRARIEEALPEIVEGARLLIEGRLSYEQALELYFPRLVDALGGERERIYSFDNAHVPYVWREASGAAVRPS